jgi:putative tryptophan/tyrosine transport system substrate-binding protein
MRCSKIQGGPLPWNHRRDKAYLTQGEDSGMRRREFIAAITSAPLAWPLLAVAQPAETAIRLGFLPLGSSSNMYDRSLVEAFRLGLRELGIVESRDIALDIVWVGDESDLPKAVHDLMQRGAKMLITSGTSASLAAKNQASQVPIVFINVGNPTGIGLVENLSRPGANITGFSDMHGDLSGKYVQFAVELSAPHQAVNYLWHTGWPDGQYRLTVAERTAKSLGVELRSRGINDIAEVNDVTTAMRANGATTLIVQSSPFAYRHRQQIIEIALNNKLAAIYAFPPAGKDGALIAYGPNFADLYRRAASYVEQILRGRATTGDLPVQQPTLFELVVNLKTAKMLGVVVPQTMLIAATEVIE